MELEMRSDLSPRSPHRTDPTLPAPRQIQTQSKQAPIRSSLLAKKPPLKTRLKKFIWNSEKGTFCGHTFLDWGELLLYSVVYLMFMCAYFMIFLFCALKIIASRQSYFNPTRISNDLLHEDVGLTAVPTTVNNFPVISYKLGDPIHYDVYVNSIDKLVQKHRRKRDTNLELGPCGVSPYGYDQTPCVIIRINKQVNWFAKPLKANTLDKRNVPKVVQEWVKTDSKLWLHCQGHYPWDKEHIGSINYYPYPPGFDPGRFPQNMTTPSQLIGVQISNFKLGMSILIDCKVWYESQSPSVSFMLHVEPQQLTPHPRSGRS